MTTMTLKEIDHGTRRRLTEEEWAGALRASDDPILPEWAKPLIAASSDLELDPALREAIRLRQSALVEVEVTAVAGGRAILAALWTDGRVGSAIVRGVDVDLAGGDPSSSMRPGIEVSAFPVRSFLDEVLRLVPPASNTINATQAVIPEEFTITLGQSLRHGDARMIAALCHDLGLEEPPAVVDSVVRTMDGQLTLTARSQGRDDVTVTSLLRCSAGWVELTRTADDQIRHTPKTTEDIGRTLLFDITGRLDDALTATPADDGTSDASDQAGRP